MHGNPYPQEEKSKDVNKMQRKTKIKVTVLMAPIYAYSYVIFGNSPISGGRILAGCLIGAVLVLISELVSTLIWVGNDEQSKS